MTKLRYTIHVVHRITLRLKEPQFNELGFLLYKDDI